MMVGGHPVRPLRIADVVDRPASIVKNLAAPLVSVIMPAYNPGEYLHDAVYSVLTQTYGAIELIVIDDGSTDGSTASLANIRDPRFILVRQKNSGKGVAMNRGIARARGDFYAIHDADDVSHPNRLERQVTHLMANPRLVGVFCGHELIIKGRRVAPTFRTKSEDECARAIAVGRIPAHEATGVFRLSVVRHIQYAEDLRVGQGLDYVLRIGEQFPLAVVGECLYAYRIHVQSNTRKDPGARVRFVQEVYDRMRTRRGTHRSSTTSRKPRASRASENALVSHFTASVADQIMAGHQLGALRTGYASWRLCPTSPYYAKPLVYALMPRRLTALYRAAKERRLSR